MDAGEREGQNVFVTRDPFLPYSDKLTNLTSVTCNHGCTTNISWLGITYIKVSKMNQRKSWPNWVKIVTKYREPLFTSLKFSATPKKPSGRPAKSAEAEGAPLSSERAEPAMRLDALPLDFVLFVPLWWCVVTRVIIPYLRGIPKKIEEVSQSACCRCTCPLTVSIPTSGSLRPLKKATVLGF